ncbi:MAG: hypothetical protein ACTSPH_04765 [Promethearchaeota archaeon]
MDLVRFIQVFIVQGVIGLFYLYLYYKILKREKHILNFFLGMFYLFPGIGVIINIIYANLTDEIIVLVLHFITYYLFSFTLIFLLLFVLIMLKSEEIITRRIQLLIIIIFGILLLGLALIPNGIVINPSTNWKPDWSWSFFFYAISVCSIFAIIPTIYFAFKIFNSFKRKDLKRRWIGFLVGIFAYYFVWTGTSYSNALADPAFRTLWSLLSLPTIFSLYFIYYGTIKQF